MARLPSTFLNLAPTEHEVHTPDSSPNLSPQSTNSAPVATANFNKSNNSDDAPASFYSSKTGIPGLWEMEKSNLSHRIERQQSISSDSSGKSGLAPNGRWLVLNHGGGEWSELEE